MKVMHNLRQRLSLPIIIVFIGLIGLVLVARPAHSSASSQGFDVLSGHPQTGMLMSLTADPGVVQPATAADAKSLVGVISNNDTNFSQRAGQVNVQTDGEANALVSTLNGDIKIGDRITASPLEGVGAKAITSAWIVGIAQASLDAHSGGAVQTTLTDSQGQKHTVYVTQLPIIIKVTYYSVANPQNGSTSTWAPQVIQNIANSLAGKHVSTRALVLSFLLFLVGVIAAAVIITSAIRSGFLAISRQPLAKFVILREEWRSFGAALLILAFTIGAVALVVRLL